jgi:xanthosine utilization system XapX-like protein
MIKRLFLPAVLAGLLTGLIYLVVEKVSNGGLVSSDYRIALVAGILTGVVIVLLFRNRPGRKGREQ